MITLPAAVKVNNFMMLWIHLRLLAAANDDFHFLLQNIKHFNFSG
jgi:hypothetical protein